ncbi:luciferase family oxidoreductase [Cohnella sp. CIP 111063]|uniref:LLM class flavin-dependent oxidoreductase n=1 Tax=unclassified Cohnella TaxID=2636738 RepID=UPI000B8C5FD3|nr:MULTISPECIES: LLM class flavin-dependent oxidoreductase [unclassified Cohnella]OXS52681.1 luciferase family oxidoreductase [Cohnella sp. CIP 111063]PRX59214.1 luciferase family oxidoreductase group 1 [Cohnella sp. SGD-V74]
MTRPNAPLFSVLDLASITQGSSAAVSFRNTLDLARRSEQWGYHRFWLAEHHGMPGIASSATSVLIGHVAGGTSTIRVGSGGIMLPNHAPLVIAEQFGTLESLYPGRIDLGLGRAPGSDQAVSRVLRRGLGAGGEDFPELLAELRAYFQPDSAPANGIVRAIPGEGLNVPIWLLGSSGFSAQLAAKLGLPFAFASHFAPDYLMPALELYRSNFRPSAALAKPYAMVGVGVTAADTEREAKRLATSQQQAFLNMIRGRFGQLPPPVDSMDGLWTPHEEAALNRQFGFAVVGDKEQVRERLKGVIESTGADELIIASQIFDHGARLRSYEIVAEVGRELQA